MEINLLIFFKQKSKCFYKFFKTMKNYEIVVNFCKDKQFYYYKGFYA